MAVVVFVVMLVRVWAAEFLRKEQQLTNIENMNSVAISRGNAAQEATIRASHTTIKRETAKNKLQFNIFLFMYATYPTTQQMYIYIYVNIMKHIVGCTVSSSLYTF